MTWSFITVFASEADASVRGTQLYRHVCWRGWLGVVVTVNRASGCACTCACAVAHLHTCHGYVRPAQARCCTAGCCCRTFIKSHGLHVGLRVLAKITLAHTDTLPIHTNSTRPDCCCVLPLQVLLSLQTINLATMSQQYKSSNLDPDQDPDLAPQPLLLLGLPQPVLHVLLSKLSSQDKVTLMRTCHQTRLAVLLTAPTIRVSIQDDMPGKEANTSLVSLVANRKQPLHLVLELAKTSDEGTSVILEKIATSHQGAAAAGGSSGHNCVRELTHQLNHWVSEKYDGFS